MTGTHDIILYNNKVHYHLTVRRNITILRGDSASGKSELIRLLTGYNSHPASSGITLICDKKCSVLTEGNWRLYTNSCTDHIFFIDDGNAFVKTKKFAETVSRVGSTRSVDSSNRSNGTIAVPKDQVTAHREADNYFVIISRETLSQLPYSKDELYGLREEADSGRDHLPGRVYNEMYRLFGKDENLAVVPEKG